MSKPAIIRWSWVTAITAERRSRAILRSIAITLVPRSVSRAAVGSSARISAGSLASARPIATRCCSPPDICAGSESARCAISR